MESFETLSFYRGMSGAASVETPLVCEMRKNRRPRNTAQEIHERADAWFYNMFGVKYRSQALFVTSSRFTARAYAASEKHIVRVIPIGPYKYCWSPKIGDMLSISIGSSGESIEDVLNKGGYTESNLLDAFNSGNEVMLYCDKYVAIPMHLLESVGVADEQLPGIYLG